MLTSRISGAPICAGEASPLRVATGGSANWSSGVRSRRSPARANRRRDSVSRGLEDASLLQSSENHGKKLTHIGHLFMTNTRASLRSDNCPISIGMGVRFGLEQVSAFVGIRSQFMVFLKDFLKGRSRPVFLVVDGLPAHKAKTVAAYVQSTRGRLELHFLPPYAPDLNPDEFVWSHLKTNGTSKKPLRKNESLKQRVTDDLSNIKKDLTFWR